MEIFEITTVVIGIILAICFILFLIWVCIMVHVLKDVPNDKIESLSIFFNKLPIKRFFSFFSNNQIIRSEK